MFLGMGTLEITHGSDSLGWASLRVHPGTRAETLKSSRAAEMTSLRLQPERPCLGEPAYLAEPAIELHVFVCWGFTHLFKNLVLLKADVQTLPDSGAACAHAVSPVLRGILQPKQLAAGGGQAPAELTFGRVAWRSERERDWRPG